MLRSEPVTSKWNLQVNGIKIYGMVQYVFYECMLSCQQGEANDVSQMNLF